MSGFRERLAEEVERLGVTWVASTLGVVRNTIYNWLGKGNVPLNNLMQLAGLGVDVVYVITGERQSTALSDEERELLVLYRAAPLAVRLAAVAALASTNAKAVGAKGKYAGADIGSILEKAPKKMTIKQEFNKKDK